MENIVKEANFAKAFYFFAFMFLVIYALNSLSSILTPIAIAILIWFLINALATQIKRIPFLSQKVGDIIAIPLSLIIIIYSMVEIGSFIASSMMQLGSTISQLDGKVNSLIEKLSLMTSFDFTTPLQKFFQEFSLSSVINKIIAAFSSIFSNIVQIFLYVLFLLIDQQFFNSKLNALFPKKETRQKANDILNSISKGVKTYIFITTVISLITGFLTYLICEMFSLQGAVLWGFIAFVLNFIPTIGSIIAVLIPMIFALIQFPEISDVLLLSLCLVLIQFVIGNILYPRLMGNKLNISQFVVILSLVVWGAMWGTVGMFLSVPLMMILMITLAQFHSTKNLAILISGDGKILS
ncbi:AI-2E family transporter [Arcobacter cloacae]|uniref:AI-2E family transporter n=1 Tax=Arcobacter cloacae TaxID=1054034 RepID=A0A6M8NID8_9BACT|nr:AI-2E family transporter [Arcobacter cloacae]QKF89561.1 putative autoinducer 2 (AI-2E family) transporter [Arcobacter cloacae]RXI42799.1 AI-2E family transporter [Arcobacter cloacae]